MMPIGTRFEFTLVSGRSERIRQLRWHLFCAGAIRAQLLFHVAEGEWRLHGHGPLDGRLAAWAHNNQPVRTAVPAWLRREVIDQLAAWALDELDAKEGRS